MTFAYETTDDAIIIRSPKKEQKIAWKDITKSVYLLPPGEVKRPFFRSKNRFISSLIFSGVAMTEHMGWVMFVDGSSEKKSIATVFIKDTDPSGRAFLEELKGYLASTWLGEQKSQIEAYRLLGMSESRLRIMRIPQAVFSMMAVFVVSFFLSTIFPVTIYISYLAFAVFAAYVLKVMIDIIRDKS